MATVVLTVSDVVVFVMEYHLIFYLFECLRTENTSNKNDFLFSAFDTLPPHVCNILRTKTSKFGANPDYRSVTPWYKINMKN